MNIIIPIGGKGERFVNEGYTVPKHMIKILGKEMICYVLDCLDNNENNIYIIYKDTDFVLKTLIETKYPNITLIPINYQTEGAAETVNYGIKYLKNLNNFRTVVMDCDTFYLPHIIKNIKISNYDNAIVYFEQNDDKNIFSYITIDNENTITKIREKERISNNANTGIYIFENMNTLLKYTNYIIDNKIKFKNEYYISTVIQAMIDDHNKFKGVYINKSQMKSLGTPELVKEFENDIYSFVFDLDGTLVDTHFLYEKVWFELMPSINKEIYNTMISGNSDATALKLINPTIDDNAIIEISAKKDQLFLKNLKNIEPIQNAFEFIMNIKNFTFHKVAVVTNSNRIVAEEILKHFNILNIIDVLVIGSECNHPKPYPDPYQKVLNMLNIPNNRTIIFEDSLSGILSAHGIFPKCLVQVLSRDMSKHEFADLTLPFSFKDININTYIDYENEDVKKLKQIMKENNPNITDCYIHSSKLKGGFIADVIAIDIKYENIKKETVLKLQNLHSETNLAKMAKLLNLYEREYYFYDKIRPHINISAPICYGIIKNNGIPIGILLEHLKSPTFKINLDLNEENINVSLKIIEKMANLHTYFKGNALQKFPELKKNNDKLFCPNWSNFIKDNWPVFKNKWNFMLSTESIAKGERIVRKFSKIQELLSSPDNNLTLIHGDIKSPNIFFRMTDYEPFFIDWQYIALGKGTQDLVFFMIESFDKIVIKEYYQIFKKYYLNFNNYSNDDFEKDFTLAACYFPFFVAIWFGCLKNEDLIDTKFPTLYINKFFSFLDLLDNFDKVI